MHSWRFFIKDGIQYSQSEEWGLSFLRNQHKNIYSIGISTEGFSEIRMALDNSERKIIATTIDKKGILRTKELVDKYSVNNQIELKIEDISKNLPYNSDSFDFIFARLVLHYLDDKSLINALKSIKRIIKDNGSFIVIVRSYDWESEVSGALFDPSTGFTTYPNINDKGEIFKYSTRRLHTVGSISSYLEKFGFMIKDLEMFTEYIYLDYERKPSNKHLFPSKLIGLHAVKK